MKLILTRFSIEDPRNCQPIKVQDRARGSSFAALVLRATDHMPFNVHCPGRGQANREVVPPVRIHASLAKTEEHMFPCYPSCSQKAACSTSCRTSGSCRLPSIFPPCGICEVALHRSCFLNLRYLRDNAEAIYANNHSIARQGT